MSINKLISIKTGVSLYIVWHSVIKHIQFVYRMCACIGVCVCVRACVCYWTHHLTRMHHIYNGKCHYAFMCHMSLNTYAIFILLKVNATPDKTYGDVIKHFPRYSTFVRGIHRSPVNSPHKGQWRGALMFSLICAWIHDWVNNREAGDLRRHQYDSGVMVHA